MVVDAAITIGRAEDLSAEELEIIQIAAWFHDTGFRDVYEGHEDRSEEIALQFLKSENAPKALIEGVLNCIQATKRQVEPTGILTKVMLDADMYHLASASYKEHSGRLQREWETIYKKEYPELEWSKLNLDFVSKHKFHTNYGNEILRPKSDQLI